MCGICGIFGRPVTEAEVEAMVATIRHRGPDGQSIYVNADVNLGLGHARLSIIDLSDGGRQPMVEPDTGNVIVFNGEIYNYREIRAELDDYPFRSTSDTEVILAAYARWGKACVERFVGMFAFALWDARKRQLFCARDRLGVKPFYYFDNGDCFIFGSEVKALLAAGVPTRPDYRTWATYLTSGIYHHGQASFFDAVRSLEPGTTLTIDSAAKRATNRYWDLAARAADTLALPLEDAADQLRDALREAVMLRLRSDVPVCVNLSGGLDSAAIMSNLSDLAEQGQEVHAFTASFDDPKYDEAIFAQQIASRVRCHHHVVRLRPGEVPTQSHQLMWHQEAPFGGIATVGYYHLHHAISGMGLKVSLEGQGSDEVLAGYDAFLGDYFCDLLADGDRATLKREAKMSPVGRTGLRLARRLREGDTTPVYQDGTLHTAPECLSSDVRMRSEMGPVFARPFGSRLANAQYRELLHTKLPRVLCMNDKLSMAFGIELRQPFLDHRLVELAIRLPSSFKISDGVGKFILRKALSDRLPEEVLWTNKRMVVTPQREWMVGPLREWIEDTISSKSFTERGFFDAAKVRALFARYVEGGVSNAFPIWQWLNVELWHQTFADVPLSGMGASGVSG